MFRFVNALNALIVLFLLAAAPALLAQTMTVTPSQGSPGSMFIASMGGLNGTSTYRLYLERGNPYVERVLLDEFMPAATDINRKLSVPTNATAGAQYLVLYSQSITAVERARSIFTVGAPLSIALQPASAEPGKSVKVTVTGAHAGTLVLNYDGKPVFGPVAVGDGVYVGKFITPSDRPTTIPSTVSVQAVNRAGKLVVATGKTNFSVLTPSGLPRIRSTLTTPPPTSRDQGTSFSFSGRLQQPDGTASNGRASFFWKGDDGHVIPVDGGVQMAADGSYTVLARAPSFYMDGINSASTGQLIGVVQDTDPDTGQVRDMGSVNMPQSQFDATDSFTPGNGQFVIQLRGVNVLGHNAPIEGAYVRVYGDLESAFTDPNDGIPPASDQMFFGMDSQFQAGQVSSGITGFIGSNGCPINFGSKLTNSLGEAAFEIDKELLKQLTMRHALEKLGEIRLVDSGAPIPGIDVFQNPGNAQYRKSSKDLPDGDLVYLTMEIFAGPKGYGETGIRDVDGNPDFPPYDEQPGIVPTYVNLAVDMQTGEVFLDGGIGQFGTTNGSEISPGVIRVNMERISPDTTADVLPYLLRIAGLGVPTGSQTKSFLGMHAYPSTTKWPDWVFAPRNSGREMRFTWDVGFGTASTPRLRLKLPGDSTMRDYGTFAIDSGSSCNVEGELDYVTQLPDLTRLNIAPEPVDGQVGIAPCYYGQVVVDRPGPDAVQDFRICTRRPPEDMNVQNPQLDLSTFRINALTARYSGNLKMPISEVTGDDPRMREYNLPPQDNASMNDGDFVYTGGPGGSVTKVITAVSDHIVGNNGTDGVDAYNPSLFGFTGNTQSRNQIDRQTVLDTGRIPLFRYPWGFPPIAGATLGADFWLGADVGFYGTAGNPHGDGTLFDATIDPRMEGGVDMFFDLDVLFGLVSASVTAKPSLDLTLREVIGKGGMFPVATDQSGICYGFDLDMELEICAIVCASDEFNLFRVQDGSGCSANRLTADKAYGRGEFDLPKPRLRPSAIDADGFGRELVVRVTSDDQLIATHFEANGYGQNRTIDADTQGIQHIDVVYMGGNTALAVWSESKLTRAQLSALMQPTFGKAVRDSTDDLARAQVLRYSWFDGTAWSRPALVPSAQDGSVGRPRLAVCKAINDPIACGLRVSKAYLVWERDANGDIRSPNMQVWGAAFTAGAGFDAAVQISNSSGSFDLHPDVAYLGSTPMVAWISGTGDAYGAPRFRQIAYRVLALNHGNLQYPVQLLAGSSGAGWPTLATRGTSGAALAFTRAQDTSLIGNRNALTMAKGSCSNGQCAFNVTEPRDAAGRQFRGERPSLTLNAAGQAVVQFRGLAYGPAANGTVGLATDPPGMLLGTGELLSLRVSNFNSATTTVVTQNLSANGLMQWRPDFVFDPALDAYVGISQEVQAPVVQSRQLEFAKRFAPKGFKAVSQAKILDDDGLMMRSLPTVPDLRIESLSLPAPYLTGGTSTSYSVTIRNAGADYDPATQGTAILVTAWDAPPGVGTTTVTPFALNSPLASNAKLTLTRMVGVPSDHQQDQRRTLFVEVRPQDASNDANGADNIDDVTTGAMPVPQELRASIATNTGVVILDWDTPADPRVVGYRVYKLAENGEFVPYGSSPASGYIDLFAGYHNIEHYRVTSYSENGIESAMSEEILAAPDKTFSLFHSGFEVAVP